MSRVDLSRMRKLYIDGETITEEEAIDLIMRCNGLETLHYYSIPNICKNFQIEGWPRIRNFSLMDEVDDKELSIVVRGMHQITSLSCVGLSFGQLTFHALQPHFSTVTVLNIGNLNERTDKFALEILSLAPHIQEFQTDTVAARDIVDSRPWICHFIHTLTVRIVFSETEDDLQPQVFKRISELDNLRILEANDNHFNLEDTYTYGVEGLKFGFAYGLKLISTLMKLEHIQFFRTNPDITSEEAEWMEKNLKSLETYRGYSGHINNRIKFVYD